MSDEDEWFREYEAERARAEALRQAAAPLVEPATRFGAALYRAVCSDAPADNQFLSPLSVHMALAMCLEGAAGETRRELERALHLEEPGSRLAYRQGVRAWLAARPGPGLSLANALFSRQGLELDDTYRRILLDVFAAAVHPLDFGRPEDACALVNAWAARKTRGMISELLTPRMLRADLLLILANAVYFKSAWERPFDPERTEAGLFHADSGTDVPADFMHGTLEAQYYEDPQCQLLKLFYQDTFALLIALPRAGHALPELEKRVTSGEELPYLGSRRVAVFLPRFKMSSSYALQQPLSRLGVHRLFRNDAQLGPMLPREPRTKLDEALHVARLVVDEEGSEAVAATMLLAVACAAPSRQSIPVFRADRPFHFQIRDAVTGLPLFLGRLLQPG